MPLKSSKTFFFALLCFSFLPFSLLFFSLLFFSFLSLSLFSEKLRYSCYANALRKEGRIWGISDLPGPKTPEGEVDLAA